MNYIFLDIETTPLEIKHEDIKTYFMDNKITKESRAFNPNYSKIITICAKLLDGETQVFSGDNEEELLNNFIGFISKYPNSVFVTYNGYGFDIPFLNVRLALNKLDTLSINLNKWNMEKSNHFDVMLFLSQNGIFTNTRMDIVARMHGVEFSGERTLGKDIEIHYKNNDWNFINEHCKQDIEILEKLFKKVFL